MLVYIDDKDDKEFHEHYEYAYAYEYDDDYDYEEDTNAEVNDYEINYEISEDGYLVSLG